MQSSQIQQPRSQSVNIDPASGMQPQHLHSMLSSGPVPIAANAADKALKPKPKGASKAGGSVSSSDDDLEIEDEDPEIRPAIITIARPETFKERLLWEAVDSVWTPRNKPASSEKIVAAIKFIGEAVRGLREQWKSQNEKLKKAELPNSETSAHAPQLKHLVGQLREIMETLAARVTKWGHPSILKRYVLSSYPLLMHSKCTCILERILSSHAAFICLRIIVILELLLVKSLVLHLHPHGLASFFGRWVSAWNVACIDSSMPYHAAVSVVVFSIIC